MRSPATPSVDQLLVLLAVAETGSFTAAAKRLGRATSAISYAIDTLEQQLGLSLFDRGTTRKPKLTQRGEAIVSEARAVAHSIETLRARVRGFLDELEPEVSLAVDSMLPGDRLTMLLGEFHAQFPTVPVRLLVQTLGGVEQAVRNGHARIGVGSQLHMDMTGFRRIDIKGVRVIPVAAPGHPLAQAGEADRLQARDFVQLVLSEQPAGTSRDFGVVSLNTWRIGDQAARYRLLLAGLGWGGMPEPVVRGDIEAGRLVRLNLPDWRGGEYTLLAIHKIDTPPGPAGRWLIERLVTLSDAVEAPAAEITPPRQRQSAAALAESSVRAQTTEVSMNESNPSDRLYLDDLRIGQRFASATHTIDEAQIKAFAAQFDPQPFHTDEKAAERTLLKGLAASGWHTAAITMRLNVESGPPLAGGVLGAGAELSWPMPTRPGDILHVESEVVEITPSRSRADRGTIVLLSRTMNQRGEVVQILKARLVVPRRGAS